MGRTKLRSTEAPDRKTGSTGRMGGGVVKGGGRWRCLRDPPQLRRHVTLLSSGERVCGWRM